MTPAPVALFVFRRPEHTARALESLRAARGASATDLFVFSDGAAGSSDLEAVAQVRDLVRQASGFKSVSVIENEGNRGLSASVQAGIALLVQRYGRVIAVEDDLVVGPYFLDFLNAGLDRYQNDDRVMQISGYMFPIDASGLPEAFFLPFITTWGWATWERAWCHFDSSGAAAERIRTDPALRRRFDLMGAYHYWQILDAQLAGRVDSWGVLWYLSVFLRDGLAMYPRDTHVKNTGFDGSGRHGVTRGHSQEVAASGLPAAWPKPGVFDPAFAAVQSYLWQQQGMLPRFKRLLRGLLP